MNKITFPGLGLELNINRVAFELFGYKIYWYAILIVMAFILAIIIFKIRDGKFGIKFEEVLDLCLFVIPISLICARLYYVLFKIDEYIINPLEIFNVRGGGLAIYGGIIGGIITCYIFCKKKKINFLSLLDFMAPALALGQSIGRWGNFINQEAFGSETYLPWRMGIINYGKYIEVHPTFLYESIATFLIFVFLIIKSKKRKFNGEITYLYLALYSFARTMIETLRTDSLMFGNFKISQVLSILIFTFSIVMLIINNIKLRKKEKESFVEN